MSHIPPVNGAASLTTNLNQSLGRLHRQGSQPPFAVERKAHEALDPAQVARRFNELDDNRFRGLLEDMIHVDGPAGLQYASLREELVTMFVDWLPLPEHEAQPEKHTYPEINVRRDEVANLALETGRLREFPDLADDVMKIASPDVVDRYVANRARETMEKHDPGAPSADANAPSP